MLHAPLPSCRGVERVFGENDGVRWGGQTLCFENATHFQNESLNRCPTGFAAAYHKLERWCITFGLLIRQCNCLSRLGKDKNPVSIDGPRKGRLDWVNGHEIAAGQTASEQPVR
jgi:hypothetical protein